MLLAASLLAGLGIGGGFAFLMHQLNPVFNDAETLHRIGGRPILGVVSRTWLERSRVRRRADVVTFAAATAALIVVFIGTFALQDAGVRLMQNFS